MLIKKAGLFPDQKTFVDMPMKFDPEEITLSSIVVSQVIRKKFTALGKPSELTKSQVDEFVNQNFYGGNSTQLHRRKQSAQSVSLFDFNDTLCNLSDYNANRSVLIHRCCTERF